MRRLLFVLPVLLAMFIGCSENSSLTSPEVQNNQKNWLPLQGDALQKFSDETVSKEINGSRGGVISFNLGVLYIPRNSFKGTEIITVSNNNEFAVIDFGPSMQFDKDLSCTVIYKDINLDGFDPSSIDFGYMDGDNFYSVEYDRLVVDTQRGYLAVIGAKFNHFSRYGFTW